MKISMNQIAEVKNEVKDRMDANWGNIISEIELNEEYNGALKGLEDFSHAILVTYLHQAKFDKEKHILRRPRNLDSMPLVGILSQRAKNRPNPIGITSVEIIERKDNILIVKGLDAIDGTPVLDIKPYYEQYDNKESSMPEWVNRLMNGYF
jgi:tRNA (adenine37-N6)-methyltransferase